VSKVDIQQILENVDEDARDNFASMDEKAQLLVIFSLEISNSNRLAVVEKRQIDFERDYNLYRSKREKKESNRDIDVLSITQEITKGIKEALAQRFDVWVWFRDRVLPVLVTGFILVLLSLVYGKLP